MILRIFSTLIVFFLAAPAFAGLVIIQQTTIVQGWQFVSSSPVANESWSAPPKAVTISFTQAVKPGSASIRVYDPYNNPVNADDTATIGNASMSVDMTKYKWGLPGAYRVEWKAGCQCSNTAVLSNSYYFNIQ